MYRVERRRQGDLTPLLYVHRDFGTRDGRLTFARAASQRSRSCE